MGYDPTRKLLRGKDPSCISHHITLVILAVFGLVGRWLGVAFLEKAWSAGGLFV